MLRVLIVVVVAMAAFVFFRLLLLTFSNRPARQSGGPPPTIEAKPHFSAAMTIRKLEFKRFDVKTGPADPEYFKETVTLHVAPEGTDDIAIYSLTVSTPKALAQSTDAAGKYSFQRNLLLVQRYDPELIERALHEHLNEIVYLSGQEG
jgi:hypothetical protein